MQHMQDSKTPEPSEEPPQNDERSGVAGFGQLLDLARILRSPDGCPWDRKQTVESLTPFLIEESYEVLHSTLHESDDETASELGDVAFVLALTLVTAEQEGLGNLDDILRKTDQKIRLRHPHVFDGRRVDSSADLHGIWEEQKRRESPESELDSATSNYHLPPPPVALPALAGAQKMQKKAARLGFDWPKITPVLDKIEEETAEVREALEAGSRREVEEEVGDLLFSVVNLARTLGLDAEATLKSASVKFRDRFNDMIDLAEGDDVNPGQATLEDLDLYWEKAKGLKKAKKRGGRADR